MLTAKSSSSSIFDSGSGLNKFLDSGIGMKLTNVFADAAKNYSEALVKNKYPARSTNGQVIQNGTANQNNPNAGGLMNSLGFGTGQTPNYLLIGLIVSVIGLAFYLIAKK